MRGKVIIKNSNEINETIVLFVTFSDTKIKPDADRNCLAVINKMTNNSPVDLMTSEVKWFMIDDR